MGMRIFAGVWAFLFLIFVGLQYNDPDPVQWMAIYGAAAVICFAYALGYPLRQSALAVAGVALIWGLTLIPDYIGKATPADMFQSMKADKPEIEEERESGGLFIVVGVMGALLWASRRKEAASADAALSIQQK